MNYQQAKDYVYGYTDYEKLAMPHAMGGYDLRRVEELLNALGNPHLAARSVHIGGTNGKGSTAVMIAASLMAAGYHTGLYTSPHLHTIRERFKVNGELITETEFADIVTRLKPKVEAVNARGTYGEITTFELFTAMAFAFFHEQAVDFQVLEVGMGGRFDATNVIRPEVCVITPIGLDHTAVLGNTLTQIAGEKAGIIKPGATVVMAPQSAEAEAVIIQACISQGAPLVRADRITARALGITETGQRLLIEGRRDSYELTLPLMGAHQVENAATAVAALEVVAEGGGLSRDSIIRGLERVSWAGRLQIIGRQPLIIVDGAHNPPAARRLREALAGFFSHDRAILIMGASADKDVGGVISELAPAFSEVIITRTAHPRALPLPDLEAEFVERGITVQRAENVAIAISQARQRAGADDLICVTGSIFVAAEAIRALDEAAPAPD